MIRAVLAEPMAWVDAVASRTPGQIGYVVRRRLARRQLGALGTGGVFGPGLLLMEPRNIQIGNEFSAWRECTLAASHGGAIRIGNHVSLNANVYMNAGSGGHITIGDDVLIGPNVVLRASDHRTADTSRPIRLQGHLPGVIVIEDDVWISANVTVVGGVRIGRGAVVGANAVVTRDVAPLSIVGGVPARVIGHRTPSGDDGSDPDRRGDNRDEGDKDRQEE